MSVITSERHKKAEKVEKSKDVAEVIREFEYIIKNKNSNIICLAYLQGKYFESI